MKDFFRYFLESELKFFAAKLIKKFKPFVIGVTGSSGKTTVKYMIGEMMRASGKKVRAGASNLNTETGLPLAILGYEQAPETISQWLAVCLGVPWKYLFTSQLPEFLVLEYAADKPGDIKYLTSIVRPQIAVITNIGVAHIEIFKTVDKIAREKWNLASAAEEKIICFKKDYAKVSDHAARAELILVEEGPIKMTAVKYLPNQTTMNIGLYGDIISTQTSFLGEHNIANLQISLIASYLAGGDFKKIVRAVETIKPQAGRGMRIIGRNEVVIIDESYNANPLSMMAALSNLANVKYSRKVAVLGEMMEIGPVSQKSHHEVAKYAREVTDFIVGVGDKFKEEKLDLWYPNVTELNKMAEDIIKKGDIVLVKGSHSNRLDKFVEILK